MVPDIHHDGSGRVAAGTLLGRSLGRPQALWGMLEPSQSKWPLMLPAELCVTKEAGGCAQTSCVRLGSLRTGPNLLRSLSHDVQGHGVQRPPREPQPCTAPSRSRPEPSHQELPWMPSAQPRASLHIFWDHKSGGFKQGNSPLSPEAGSQKSGVGRQQPPPCPQGWSPSASPSPWGPGAPWVGSCVGSLPPCHMASLWRLSFQDRGLWTYGHPIQEDLVSGS